MEEKHHRSWDLTQRVLTSSGAWERLLREREAWGESCKISSMSEEGLVAEKALKWRGPCGVGCWAGVRNAGGCGHSADNRKGGWDTSQILQGTTPCISGFDLFPKNTKKPLGKALWVGELGDRIGFALLNDHSGCNLENAKVGGHVTRPFRKGV